MKKALIIFGSTTGNTEAMADMVGKILESNEVETVIKNVTDAETDDLKGDYDVVVLGCPAYGDDDIELQEDFEEFYEKMTDMNLDGRKYAVFAPGDSSYQHFGGSVDMLEEKIADLGGKILVAGLKIDGDPEGEKGEIETWGDTVAKSI